MKRLVVKRSKDLLDLITKAEKVVLRGPGDYGSSLTECVFHEAASRGKKSSTKLRVKMSCKAVLSLHSIPVSPLKF